MMRYEHAAANIPKSFTGIYIAYPTSSVFKPIFRGYRTEVNSEHTKVGIAKRSFSSREQGYIATFQSEVKFFPMLALPAIQLSRFEAQLIGHLLGKYHRSGPAREWFHTTERQAIAELIWSLGASGT